MPLSKATTPAHKINPRKILLILLVLTLYGISLAQSVSAAQSVRVSAASVAQALAHASSLTFSENMTEKDDTGLHQFTVVGRVQRPNKVMVTVKRGGTAAITAVSDGAYFTVFSSSTHHFVKVRIPQDSFLTDDSTMYRFLKYEIGNAGSLALLSTAETFLKPNFDLHYLIPASQGVTQTVTATTSAVQFQGKASEVLTQKLMMTRPGAPGSYEIVLKLTVDKATSALRQSTFQSAMDGKPLSLENKTDFTTYSLSNANLPQSQFAFAPPPTATTYVPPLGSVEIGDSLPPGSTAPNFAVQTSDGKPIKLSQYAGKVVVIDLWATWCGPCMIAMPVTDRIAQTYQPKGVVFMAICVHDQKSRFDAWLPKHRNMSLPFLFDPKATDPSGGFATQLYHSDALPTQFVIGKNGKIIATFVGYSPQEDADETQLAHAIDVALSSK